MFLKNGEYRRIVKTIPTITDFHSDPDAPLPHTDQHERETH
jgi:hypothetical protein